MIRIYDRNQLTQIEVDITIGRVVRRRARGRVIQFDCLWRDQLIYSQTPRVNVIYEINSRSSLNSYSTHQKLYTRFEFCCDYEPVHFIHIIYSYPTDTGTIIPQIAIFMGPTWGPPGSCRPQMGHMLARWTLLSGTINPVPVERPDEYRYMNHIHSLGTDNNTIKRTHQKPCPHRIGHVIIPWEVSVINIHLTIVQSVNVWSSDKIIKQLKWMSWITSFCKIWEQPEVRTQFLYNKESWVGSYWVRKPCNYFRSLFSPFLELSSRCFISYISHLYLTGVNAASRTTAKHKLDSKDPINTCITHLRNWWTSLS